MFRDGGRLTYSIMDVCPKSPQGVSGSLLAIDNHGHLQTGVTSICNTHCLHNGRFQISSNKQPGISSYTRFRFLLFAVVISGQAGLTYSLVIHIVVPAFKIKKRFLSEMNITLVDPP